MIHKCGKLIEDAGAAYDRKDHLDSIRMITQQGVVFDWSTNSVQLMFRISNSEEKSNSSMIIAYKYLQI